MEKLVRDRIPSIMFDAGVEASIRYVGSDERLSWLNKKLFEEAQELQVNPCLDECADVFEVLRSIAAALGHTVEDVTTAANTKRDARGAFNNGCILTVEK